MKVVRQDNLPAAEWIIPSVLKEKSRPCRTVPTIPQSLMCSVILLFHLYSRIISFNTLVENFSWRNIVKRLWKWTSAHTSATGLETSADEHHLYSLLSILDDPQCLPALLLDQVANMVEWPIALSLVWSKTFILPFFSKHDTWTCLFTIKLDKGIPRGI